MVIFIFLKFGMVKLFETLQTISNMKMNIFQIKLFNEITLLLFMIYSFIKYKVLVSLPKSFHGPLGMRMHCNWLTDYAIDHSSIGLKRLTIQPVFNEVSLFTFSKGTHGFDVTVPKNYLKGPFTLADYNLEWISFTHSQWQWTNSFLLQIILSSQIGDAPIHDNTIIFCRQVRTVNIGNHATHFWRHKKFTSLSSSANGP